MNQSWIFESARLLNSMLDGESGDPGVSNGVVPDTK
jgi:hypothetical protein